MMILCLLLTLYGRDHIAKFTAAMTPGLRNTINGFVRNTAWNSIGALKHYWVARNRDDRKIQQCYCSDKAIESHMQLMYKTHPGSELVGITHSAFGKISKAKIKTLG
jgi:hypothetical protein